MEHAPMAKPMFEHVALIGLGLIGSSLSHAIRRGGLARRITGAAKSEATRETAERLKLADTVYADPAEAVKGADLVILCTPVGTYGAIAEAVAPALADGAIL